METWNYLDKQNQPKQVLEEELSGRTESGEISAKTLVWREGMTDWSPAAETLPELFSDVPATAVPAIPAHLIQGPAPGQACHEVDFELFGDDMQIVEVELDPGETVIAEAGAMNYLEEDISFEAKMGDGSEPDKGVMGKLLSVGKRALTGESLFMTHFSHTGSYGKRRASFAAPYPGKIVPLNLAEISSEFLCQK